MPVDNGAASRTISFLRDRPVRRAEKMNTSAQRDAPNRPSAFSAIAPGLLVAATGVGAGDLLTASLAGSAVGLAIVWAAIVGAVLKWFLNEGLARWQMATGSTLLEGWFTHLGRWIRWVFPAYLFVWSLFTGGALINACGVAGTGLCMVGENMHVSKIAWGVIHSLIGLALVWMGGFRLFEKLMAICIGVMFATVVLTAALIGPDWTAVARGSLLPTIPNGGLPWVLGVLGGVGGTLTLLSYGYWIRERRRDGAPGVRACRFDLTVGYAMTAVFGVAMVIIGSRVRLEKGPTVALDLAEQLAAVVGPAGRWVFLAGFWGAVFSSLLGVWQSVPYLFADYLTLRRGRGGKNRQSLDLSRTRAYRAYLVALAIVPLPLLMVSVRKAQLIYAVLGSLFMPLLALTLLIMNNRTDWVGRRFRNGLLTNLVLLSTLLFFAFVAIDTTVRQWSAWTTAGATR